MIRLANDGDVGRIWAIEQQCFSDPWTIDQFLDVMKFPGYVKFVWEEEGEICGYIIGMVVYDDADNNIANSRDVTGHLTRFHLPVPQSVFPMHESLSMTLKRVSGSQKDQWDVLDQM